MRILVADDDRLARTVLKRFLEQSNYEVTTVEEGNSALRLLIGSEPLHIAIIDWNMPGMTGPDLCAEVRSRDLAVQPYILMLSAKKEKAEIAEGLDAGADDFVTKPFNIVEMLARLRVAERAIERQLGLHQQIRDLKGLPPRARLNHSAEAEPPAPAERQIKLSAAIGLEANEVDAVVLAALKRLGLPRSVAAPDPGGDLPNGSSWVAWAALVFPKAHIWLDLLFDLEDAAATAIFTHSQHRPPQSEQERAEFLAEFHHVLCTSLFTALQVKDIELIFPFRPAAKLMQRPLRPAQSATHHYVAANHALRLTLAPNTCFKQKKLPDELEVRDILAEGYPAGVPLLKQGTVLTERFIGKISGLDHSVADKPRVSIFPPSPLSLDFNPAPLTGFAGLEQSLKFRFHSDP